VNAPAASGDFLAQMAASSRARVDAARRAKSDAVLWAESRRAPPAPRLRLSPEGFDLIAEVKLRSPAMGALKGRDEDVAGRVGSYAFAGAAAISVLTEPSRFDGALEHLALGVQALAGRAPAMRKDFIVDPYQVAEARLAGAGGVLAILRMIPRADTVALIEAATDLGLFVLLEAFDEADLALAADLLRSHQARAQAAQAPLLVGVNCRDLVTLQVVPGRLELLAPHLPRTAPRVAESGVETPEQAGRLVRAGYTMALVGSALMKSVDPQAAVRALLAAGREAAASAAIAAGATP
jgi:indole-3-glycerol phosphate synthase